MGKKAWYVVAIAGVENEGGDFVDGLLGRIRVAIL